jgi:hypothetical protein
MYRRFTFDATNSAHNTTFYQQSSYSYPRMASSGAKRKIPHAGPEVCGSRALVDASAVYT